MTVKITNIVKLYTLLLLKKRPMHGYELIKELEAAMLKDISASHVYPFLQTLQKNKFVSVTKPGQRDKKSYSLTKEGEKFAKDMINQFAAMMDLSMSTKIKVCSHCKCKIAEGGVTKKIKTKQHFFCCIQCAKAFSNK